MKLLLGSRHIIEVDQNDESKATLASMKQVSKRISEELNPTSTVQEQEGSVAVGSEGCVQQELEQLLARAQMKLKARAKSTATAGRYKKAAAVEEEAPVETAMVQEKAAAGVVDDADPIGNQVLQNSAEISGQSSDDGLEKHAGMPSVMCTAPAMLRRAREGCDPVGDVEGGSLVSCSEAEAEVSTEAGGDSWDIVQSAELRELDQQYLSVLDTELGGDDTDVDPSHYDHTSLSSVLSAFGDDERRDDGSEREASGDGCATEVTESTQKISHLFDELTAFQRMAEEPGWDSELEELMQCIRREVLQELTRHGVDAAELDALELETHSMTPQPPGALASVRQMFGCDGE